MIFRKQLDYKGFLRSLTNSKLILELDRAVSRNDRSEIFKCKNEITGRGVALLRRLIIANQTGDYVLAMRIRSEVANLGFEENFQLHTLFSIVNVLSILPKSQQTETKKRARSTLFVDSVLANLEAMKSAEKVGAVK